MVARSLASGQGWTRAGAYVVAGLVVLPLLAPEVWSGFRLAVADPVLGVVAPGEQPLSAHSPAGPWALGLSLAWFGLASWRRNWAVWEVGLVLLGGVLALLRAGNAWLDALAVCLPLAQQLGRARLGRTASIVLASIGVAASVMMLSVTRPPVLPEAALDAAAAAALAAPVAAPASGLGGDVLADWRWAPDLQRRLGNDRHVLAAAGIASEPAEFGRDYVLISQGHVRWRDLLRRSQVDLLVVDAVDQQRALADLVRAASDWQVVYDAGGAVVAQRVQP